MLSSMCLVCINDTQTHTSLYSENVTFFRKGACELFNFLKEYLEVRGKNGD